MRVNDDLIYFQAVGDPKRITKFLNQFSKLLLFFTNSKVALTRYKMSSMSPFEPKDF